MHRTWAILLLVILITDFHKQNVTADDSLRVEHFDQPPADWEGINNRNTHFAARTVKQDFGYSPSTNHAGGQRGEIGGRINPAAEAAYYGFRLPQPLSFDDPFTASGKVFVPPGPGHFLLGLFNPKSMNEWRTPNTMVARIQGRGDHLHCHVEYCTSRWRCDAGVIGEIVPGQRINAAALAVGRTYPWKLTYQPADGEHRGKLTFALGDGIATCSINEEHHRDGAEFTHFGLLPVLKSWDDGGEVWIDDVTINSQTFDFDRDPAWEESNNRKSYETTNTRPRFDFGWSPTKLAGGKSAGELGGLIFRGDCREPHRMGAYGARISPLNLDSPLVARGKLSMTRGVTDSTASIGFYHSVHSMQSNPRQDISIPMDYLGINIEGPSSEGFYFYPVFRGHGNVAQTVGYSGGKSPRIYPNRDVHQWMLKYEPAAAEGRGRITVTLDEQSCTMDLEADSRRADGMFDRFGICTPWVDGNSVTVFFDDIEYTCRPGR